MLGGPELGWYGTAYNNIKWKKIMYHAYYNYKE